MSKTRRFAVGYYCSAGSADEMCSELEASILSTARTSNLSLRDIWPDGSLRANRTRALEAFRKREADVLIVPSLGHLSQSPAKLIQLVEDALGTFKNGRLLTCDGQFDSDKPQARMCWQILCAVTELEAELARERSRRTVLAQVRALKQGTCLRKWPE